MLLRCMMIVFLLFISAMPTWASIKDAPTTVTEQMTMEDALSKVTIESEDWLDGDTYYIRYTFTNPTNMVIDKQVDFLTITYDLCHTEIPYQSITQYNDTISHIIIPPHSTYTTTIALKQLIPAMFNKLTDSEFYFKDGSSLQYYSIKSALPISSFSVSPIISPSGNISLKIQNNSPSETITELRNIHLDFVIEHKHYNFIQAEPIALQLKPNESHFISLSTIDSTNATNSSSSFTLNDKTANGVLDYIYHIDMKINGIPHTYFDSYTMSTKLPGSSSDTFINKLHTHYQPIADEIDSKEGAFYLDETHLYGYAKVKNISDRTFSSSQASYRLFLPYFDHNSYYQEQRILINLPQNFHLSAHKLKYISFKIPLPSDFHRLYAKNGITAVSSDQYLEHIKLIQVSDASKIPQKRYTVSDKITSE